MERIKAISWWRWALLAVSLAATIYVALNEDLVTLILVVAALVPAVVAVGNPFKARPRPELMLQPRDEEPNTIFILGKKPRTVDVDAVVDNAGALARSLTSNSLRWLTGIAQKPTEEDLEKYRADVDEYLVELRSFVEEAAEWIDRKAIQFEGSLIQLNDSDVDAEDARVSIEFPVGSKVSEPNDTDPPEEPQRPVVETRPGPLTKALFSRQTPRMTPLSDRFRDVSPTEPETFSIWDPEFQVTARGSLEISYRRQSIRHREKEASGRPFKVLVPPGTHQIPWRVSARNLPHPAEGTWTFAWAIQDPGPPITSLGSLRAALAGEPEPDLEAFFGPKTSDGEAGS